MRNIFRSQVMMANSDAPLTGADAYVYYYWYTDLKRERRTRRL